MRVQRYIEELRALKPAVQQEKVAATKPESGSRPSSSLAFAGAMLSRVAIRKGCPVDVCVRSIAAALKVRMQEEGVNLNPLNPEFNSISFSDWFAGSK